MDFFIPVIILLITVVYYCYSYWDRFRLRHISGPPGYPIIGNFQQFEQNRFHETLAKWTRTYGDIYKFNLFGDSFVVVSSEKGIREMLITRSEDFASRPSSFRIDHFHSDNGILFSPFHENWSRLKKISMGGLKLVGEGVQRLEDISLEIINDVVKEFEDKNNEAFDCREILHNSVANITALLVLGSKLSKKDLNELIVLDGKLNYLGAFLSEVSYFDKWPWMRHLPTQDSRWLKELKQETMDWFTQKVDEKINRYREGEVGDALGDLIAESEKLESDVSLTRRQIDTIARELIGAGILTTSTALYSIVAQWVGHPDVQARAQQEISAAIGDRQVTIKDRALMPYIESMFMELLRLLSHVPMALPHFTVRDTQVQNIKIPARTHVWPNLWFMHHDERLWEDPWDFKADRFLDKDGKLVAADHPLRKRLLPFGAGRRVCVGEAMARNRIFLYIVTLLQRFTFQPEDINAGTPCDPRKFKLGIVIYPDSYKIKAIPRYK